MKPIVMIATTLVFVLHATASMAADTKTCKEGQVFDPQTGKCVTKRGS